MEIPALAGAINAAADAFEIGRLQELRASLRSRARVAASTIFDRRTIHPRYAFHVGGRTELQFNIGLEERNDRRVIRHGVAFSLELSQSLPSIEPLLPKIARFNDYVRSRPEDLPGFQMWHHDRGGRHDDHGVAPIDDQMARPGSFIMLGRWVHESDVSVEGILLDFDRLLPLYAHVEGDDASTQVREPLSFKPGCPSFVGTASASIPAQVIDVALRHKVLQRTLYACLCSESGAENVAIEHQLDCRVRVDAAVRARGGFDFYELKVSPSVQASVRPAIGQLLEYAHWPNASRAERMVVVGEAAADADARSYMQLLRDRFSLPLWYRQLLVSPPALGPWI